MNDYKPDVKQAKHKVLGCIYKPPTIQTVSSVRTVSGGLE